MAIVIPSKYIYSRLFDPIVDNNIASVEVTATKATEQINYRDRVYDNEFTELGLYEPDNYDLKADSKYIHQQPATQPEAYYYAEAFSYVNIRPAYTTISIKIPRKQDKKYVKKVYGEQDIGYSLTLTQKETVPITIKVNISSSNGQPDLASLNFSYGSFSWDYDNRQIEDINEAIELKDFLSITDTVTVTEANGTPVQGVSVTASKTLTNQENIPTVKATLNTVDDSWNLLNLKFLTAVYYAKASCKDYQESSDTYAMPIIKSQQRSLKGEAVIYSAQKLSVTIYGDTVVLDLTDNAVKIGGGNKVFSFDGNELIQTTNTPTPESQYQQIIDHWKNGKQTAVISCPIADYYTKEEEITIEIYMRAIDNDTTYCSIRTTAILFQWQFIELENGMRLRITTKAQLIDSDSKLYQYLARSYPENNYPDFGTYKATAISFKAISADLLFAPMIFQIGDIVEPYVYTNKGDKPLSYNKDFTPKQFKVVGTKISKRQGVTQELTLQEI